MSSVEQLVSKVYAPVGVKSGKKRKADDISPPPSVKYTVEDVDSQRTVPVPRTAVTLSALANAFRNPDSWQSVRYAVVLRSRLERMRRLYYAAYLRSQATLANLSGAVSGSGSGGTRKTGARFASTGIRADDIVTVGTEKSDEEKVRNAANPRACRHSTQSDVYT